MQIITGRVGCYTGTLVWSPNVVLCRLCVGKRSAVDVAARFIAAPPSAPSDAAPDDGVHFKKDDRLQFFFPLHDGNGRLNVCCKLHNMSACCKIEPIFIYFMFKILNCLNFFCVSSSNGLIVFDGIMCNYGTAATELQKGTVEIYLTFGVFTLKKVHNMLVEVSGQF